LQQHEESRDVGPSDSVSNSGSTPSKATSSSSFSAASTQLQATERQRQQSMQLQTIMQLMNQLSTPNLQEEDRNFLKEQLAFYRAQVRESQAASAT